MEDKKEYSIVGKVEIGTDEYRDLIEARMTQEKRADKYMTEGWKKDEELKKKDEEICKLKQTIKKYETLLQKSKEPINADSISDLMNAIFGED